jgi:hypothetical protein
LALKLIVLSDSPIFNPEKPGEADNNSKKHPKPNRKNAEKM